MKSFLCFTGLLLMAVLWACQKQSPSIANPKDYAVYLTDTQSANQLLETYSADIAFWNSRLQADPGNYVFMLKKAYLLTSRFQASGQVEDLYQADTLLHGVNAKLRNSEPSVFYTLSQSAVTRHQFRQAMDYTQQGMQAGGQEYVTNLLTFDVSMELGQYLLARQSLHQLKDKTAFDYLIRKAKLKDHEGDLDSAIVLMEQAFDKVKNLGRKSLYCWTLSNLGDMYGHANRIEDSYKAYLEVLETDPGYHYALKGIAWIAFSHDRNTAEARRIYTHLLAQTHLPDLYLNLAEIAAYEGNSAAQEKNIAIFLTEVLKPKYGDMYNKYLVNLYTGQCKNYKAALQIAQREVENRPTAETYDLLAWSYLHQGNVQKALALAENRIEGRTFEPQVFYHLGVIYKANQQPDKARFYLEKALESEYEIGPALTNAVRAVLNDK
jgi:tetratricopeptide (TPR) repeat protein